MKLKIVGMDCGSCAMTIENSMRQLDGVDGRQRQLHHRNDGADR